ncbi:MAG TPA: ferrous iron transport protein A [Candidatus Ventrousia excrementavium]|uniref:Ferrous iron transport protein A n=1 Tax=Candidatus Ventrousia excrementavium TaxID=2840961 RepID=A0A9D1IV29_9CLOT|nr:ferrous iron transport protein A [Candidatus Ventrousia excrementavium]
MSTSEPLSCLHEGQRARVLSILESGAMRRRLQDIGLIEGTTVECVQKSPAGDPVAYGIRGAIVALRAEQAAAIIVQR